MRYNALWKLTADLVASLRKSGESIPPNVMKDLRSAKTMIEILKVDQSHSENLSRIEEFINNVQMYVMPATKRKFGKKYLDEWTNKLAETQRNLQAEEKKPSIGFPIGIPRDKSWVRIKPSKEICIETIKQLSRKIGLKHKTQKDRYVLVYGAEDKVKRFVKKVAELFNKSGNQ